jgi:glyoxylase-like metal-dependent hydrolase (beta-lactamase superfamily II)
MGGDMRVDVLIQGFPGRSLCHGGLGWSTITLLRDTQRTVLIDVGAFGVRRELIKQLRDHGVAPDAVTDVVLTHAHYDHSVNFTLFPNATPWIGDIELEWAASQPPGFNPLPELYVQALAKDPRTRRIRGDQEFLPGLRAIPVPGHTPGGLLYLLECPQRTLLFTGDSAKNRAELLSRDVDSSLDPVASRQSIDTIWALWRHRPGTVLVPGHDLCMVLDAEDQPVYLGERRAGIEAWFSESIASVANIDLCCEPDPRARRQAWSWAD